MVRIQTDDGQTFHSMEQYNQYLESQKPKTIKAKQLVQQALNLLPQDEALAEARNHLRAALMKIDIVEQKRLRRSGGQTPAQSWNTSLEQGRQQLQEGVNKSQQFNPLQAISLIDQMISSEQAKLDTIKQKATPKTKPTGDDGDIQNMRG